MNRALFLFRNGRIDDIFSVDAAHDDRTRGPRPRNIRNGQRHGRTDHGEGFGSDVGIDGKRGGDYDDVVEDSLREKGTDRTVDEARDEDSFIGSASLSLFEAAGNFSDREHFFFIIDGQGEEIHSLSGLFRHTDGDVHHRFAAADKAGAVGLFGIFSDFYGQFSARVVRFENPVIV